LTVCTRVGGSCAVVSLGVTLQQEGSWRVHDEQDLGAFGRGSLKRCRSIYLHPDMATLTDAGSAFSAWWGQSGAGRLCPSMPSGSRRQRKPGLTRHPTTGSDRKDETEPLRFQRDAGTHQHDGCEDHQRTGEGKVTVIASKPEK
jgi:hypothetical protein